MYKILYIVAVIGCITTNVFCQNVIGKSMMFSEITVSGTEATQIDTQYPVGRFVIEIQNQDDSADIRCADATVTTTFGRIIKAGGSWVLEARAKKYLENVRLSIYCISLNSEGSKVFITQGE